MCVCVCVSVYVLWYTHTHRYTCNVIINYEHRKMTLILTWRQGIRKTAANQQWAMKLFRGIFLKSRTMTMTIKQQHPTTMGEIEWNITICGKSCVKLKRESEREAPEIVNNKSLGHTNPFCWHFSQLKSVSQRESGTKKESIKAFHII